MDKKLKFNAFLKGVSFFAFVAFCLLAILAGVTLPFLSKEEIGTEENQIHYLHSSCVADLTS